MKKLTKAIAAIMLMTAVFCAACTKDPNNNNGNIIDATEIPVVETAQVLAVAGIKTEVRGVIISDGGGTISECGVCWSTQPTPTVNCDHAVAEAIEGAFSCELIGLELGTTYYVRAYAINSKGIGYGNELSFIPSSGNGGGSNHGHAYVDLGLPSGTLWATCNIGANTPEDYGDYFAWGETETKDTYNWGTYQYCTGGNYEYPYYNMLTKYCNDASYGFNGFADDLTVLLPEDDAATANWGGDWRMPTREECNELLENTTNTWTTQNEVYGRLFTASNGASLFLPAAGYRWDDELYDAGSNGNVWSSSLGTNYPGSAWNLYFGSGSCGMNSGSGRGYGFSVRPVCSARQN